MLWVANTVHAQDSTGLSVGKSPNQRAWCVAEFL
jgi:hypothetical protein